MRKEICEFLASPGLELVQATSAGAALDMLSTQRPDGIVVDWAVSNEGDVRFIEEVQRRLEPAIPPVIVLGAARLDSSLGRELTRCCRISAIRYVQSHGAAKRYCTAHKRRKAGPRTRRPTDRSAAEKNPGGDDICVTSSP
jgi:DNA-binding NarL/FixJ family response regulator